MDYPDDRVGGQALLIDASERHFEESVAQWLLSGFPIPGKLAGAQASMSRFEWPEQAKKA